MSGSFGATKRIVPAAPLGMKDTEFGSARKTLPHGRVSVRGYGDATHECKRPTKRGLREEPQSALHWFLGVVKQRRPSNRRVPSSGCLFTGFYSFIYKQKCLYSVQCLHGDTSAG